MYLIFDTETTGLPRDYNSPLTDFDNWPRLVQLAWQLHDAKGGLLKSRNYIVKPDGFSIPYNSEKIHGISTEKANKFGLPLKDVILNFLIDVNEAQYVAGHNIEFDLNVVGCELLRLGEINYLQEKTALDTKSLSTDFCAIPGGRGGKYKWPTLTELYYKLFDIGFEQAHDAAFDVSATGKAFFELIKRGVIVVDSGVDASSIEYEEPVLSSSNFHEHPADIAEQNDLTEIELEKAAIEEIVIEDSDFIHLHVHSQYSVLQSTSEISGLVKRAKEWNMTAIALTDHGNMYAAFNFVSTALKNELKPIVGCEFNVCRNLRDKTIQDNGFQIVLLAKNKKGYHNVAKLSSIAHTEGFYYLPRIDRETLLQYKEDLIVSSGNIWGEIGWKILNEGEEKAEEAFQWWLKQFGEDFYVELNRHGLGEEDVVNRTFIRFCSKYNVKYYAANSSYYTDKTEAEAQDALICVKEGEFVSRPKKYIGKRGREFRFGFPNDEYYLKSPQEMNELFRDLPLAISTTLEIAAKCESYKLAREVLLPKFDIPHEFLDAEDGPDGGKRGENAFLKHLSLEGAVRRYGAVSDEIRQRLDFELTTIANTGYPGYFLIVQDFCNEARRMGVSVGPGRGSAAGSAVAYCIGITNVDPIKYNLLFERFLNPERVSMPDIDIDFDDEGRDRVINYVRKKYGRDMVAQIITYGTMGGKSAIRDAGRVFELPLPDTDKLAKLMPDNQDLRDIFKWDDKKLNEELKGDDLQNAKRLREILKENSDEAKVLTMAGILEGSVRNTGTHACGVIITPDLITNYVPVATAKDSDMWCTQFDNSVVESAGLLKMDFLGLKTLTLIKDTLRIIKQRHNIEIDIEAIPLDDLLTYQLFQRGHTVGIFQYESEGMQKCLRDLKPTVFDDLIAMNALYRPGPLEYIPSFVKRKNGVEAIAYDLPEMEEYLKETYGITVYQEQVMLLSQKLANFTKGEADVLRKAMGKKQKDVLDKMKGKFIDGATANNHPADRLEKIWTDWEAFASYAFNKSHSTCYAWIGYQTAYLKAHYPAEYMAAVLSNNMNDLKSVSFFMQDCKKQNIPVLGPDVNESKALFSVNQKGEIRFGLAAIKGVGESAVDSIIEEQKNGRFNSIFDFLRRVDSKASNKKTLENLALAGALDEFRIVRSAYFTPDGKSDTYVETLVKFAANMRDAKNSSQVSLFGDVDETVLVDPQAPFSEQWDTMTQLTKEKEVVGMFISGHPLDDFALEIKSFCSKGGLALLENMEANKNKDLKIAGTVVEFTHRLSKSSNKPFGTFKLEDYEGSFEFILFGEDYLKNKHFFQSGEKLFLSGRIQPRKYTTDTNALEFKINRIEPLFEVREKLGRYLDIHISLDKLTDELVQQLELSLKNGKGKTQVRISVNTGAGSLKLNSGNTNKVDVTSELLNELEALTDIEVELCEK